MAAFTQIGYGIYPSAVQQLSSVNATPQSSNQSNDVPIQQTNNASTLSPKVSTSDCHVIPPEAGGVKSSSLSPDDMSQHSNQVAGRGDGVDGELTMAGPTSNGDGDTLASGSGGSGSSGGVGGGGSCCENGRPIVTDPVTGQSVCSCQYDSARLALSSYSRLPAASVGVYGTPYPSTDQNPYQSIGVDTTAFYTPLSNPYALKDGVASSEMSPAWTSGSLQPTTSYYSYDPMSAYGYGAASYDLAARRKNATRESTATLKAWLNEHKKNPYPTKGEKIMLAIITKMTLTQVSTWFANARRRLKKENKMTWEPKNRTDDDDDAIVSDDEKDKDASTGGDKAGDLTDDNICRQDLHKNHGDELDAEDQKLQHSQHPSELRDGLGFPGNSGYQNTGIIGGPMGGGANSAYTYHSYHHQHPAYYHHQQAMLNMSYQSDGGGSSNNLNSGSGTCNESKNPISRDCGLPIPASKPKIWSLADTVACKTPPLPSNVYTLMGQQQHQQQQQSSLISYHMSNNQHQQQQHQQAQHPEAQAPQQYMLGNFVGMPYSRTPTAPYGAFAESSVTPASPPTAHSLHTMSNMQYGNKFNNRINMDQAQQLQQDAVPESMHRHGTVSASTQRPTVGFPEAAQPDTPPQTPPNMKMMPNIMTANLMLTNNTSITTCRSISNNNNRNNNSNNNISSPYNRQIQFQQQNQTAAHCYNSDVAAGAATSQLGGGVATGSTFTAKHFSSCSPRDESSSGSSSSCRSNGSPIPHHPNEAFKPPLKSQQISVASFVPSV